MHGASLVALHKSPLSCRCSMLPVSTVTVEACLRQTDRCGRAHFSSVNVPMPGPTSLSTNWFVRALPSCEGGLQYIIEKQPVEWECRIVQRTSMYLAAAPRVAALPSADDALVLAADVVVFHTEDAVAAIHVWFSDGFVDNRSKTKQQGKI